MELIDRDAINEKCRNTKIDAVIPEWETLSTVAKQSVIKLARWYKTTLNTAPAVYIAPEQFGLWIPVTERRPNKGIECLCRCIVNDCDNFPFYMVLRYMLIDENPHFQYETMAGLKVTHWMPLPEPPKEG